MRGRGTVSGGAGIHTSVLTLTANIVLVDTFTACTATFSAPAGKGRYVEAYVLFRKADGTAAKIKRSFGITENGGGTWHLDGEGAVLTTSGSSDMTVSDAANYDVQFTIVAATGVCTVECKSPNQPCTATVRLGFLDY